MIRISYSKLSIYVSLFNNKFMRQNLRENKKSFIFFLIKLISFKLFRFKK